MKQYGCDRIKGDSQGWKDRYCELCSYNLIDTDTFPFHIFLSLQISLACTLTLFFLYLLPVIYFAYYFLLFHCSVHNIAYILKGKNTMAGMYGKIKGRILSNCTSENYCVSSIFDNNMEEISIFNF